MTKTLSDRDVQDRLEHAHQLAVEKGERFTPLRAHVFELICRHNGAIKAYELLDQLRPERGSPKPPTIYRAIDFLSKLGLIHRVEALNAFIACDHSHDGHLAEFFICETCLAVEERHAHDHTDCKPSGFSISRSVVEHYGRCGACAA